MASTSVEHSCYIEFKNSGFLPEKMSRNRGLSREEIMQLLDLDNSEGGDDSDYDDPVNESNESDKEDEESGTEQPEVPSTSELCRNTNRGGRHKTVDI